MKMLTWFAKNGVAANLLMVLIIIGGWINAGKIRKEVFPEFSSDLISVTVPYLGAAPQEVEEAICARIEEAVQDLESVKRLRSIAAEGAGTVTIELLSGSNVRNALDDIKARVDAIDTFPVETEKPIVQELVVRKQVLNIAISGQADERTLKHLAERVRDEVSSLDGISQVELAASRPYEISIEVSENALRRYGLTFDQVAQMVRRSSLDLPGGSIKTEGGEILLRTQGQAYRGHEFAELVLITRPDGSRLTLGQVATVVDGFADTDTSARFDGEPAVLVKVFRVGEQAVTDIATKVKRYVDEARPELPTGISMTIWQDDTEVLRSRMDTLFRNGRAGLILVLLVLALFLRLRLALWVSLGILVSFMGTLWLMPTLGVSISLISLFAFIIVLGIVVDDAIVVGENIYRHHQMGKEGLTAAIDGLREVAVPVTFSVLTTIAAFAPLTMVSGNTGKFMRVIPLVVMSTLAFSLLESLFVLPSHLSHLRNRAKKTSNFWTGLQGWVAALFDRLIERSYRPTLDLALRWRYATVAIAVALLMMTLGFIGGGHIKFTFFPPIEGNNVVAFLTLPQGTPPEATAKALEQLENSAEELRREVAEAGEPKAFRHILATIGEHPFRQAQSRTAFRPTTSAAHLGEVNIELLPGEERDVTATELTKRWRDLTGSIADAIELSFVSSVVSTGEAINIQLAGPDLDDLQLAAAQLKTALAEYPGVFDITDSFRAGKEEVQLDILPRAESLGLTLSDVARQVRQAFYGEEAQRIQRGRDDVRVMVRYPEDERRQLHNLESMRIRTPQGDEVPIASVATMEPGRGYASIARTDRNRTVTVTADVDLEQANSNEILAEVERTVLPRLVADHRGLSYSLEGEQQEQRETLSGLAESFGIALILIYILLAVPFRSYLQPMIVMSAIPFGILGAIWGHVLVGRDLTALSFFGVVALTGVVVNDSLVLVDFVNRAYRGGMPLHDAIAQAGETRFRPIILTSLTTFVGLTPLLLEKSLQAQFLIPMAVSLAFGVLFATGIILILVPVGYYILEDITNTFRRLWSWYWDKEEDRPEDSGEGDFDQPVAAEV